MSAEVIKVKHVMKPDVDVVDGMMTVYEVLNTMKHKQNKSIIVQRRDEHDEYGGGRVAHRQAGDVLPGEGSEHGGHTSDQDRLDVGLILSSPGMYDYYSILSCDTLYTPMHRGALLRYQLSD